VMTAPSPERRPSPLPHTRAWGIGLAFATAVVSGVAIFVNGYAVKRFDGSAPFTTGKNLVAAVLLTGLVALASARRSADGWTPPRTTFERIGLLVVGVVGGSVPFLLFFEGLSRATSTDAAFIQKTLVVWVGVLAVLFLRERLGWPHLLAIGAILVGQVLLADDVSSLELGSGELLVLAATLLWSIEILVAKRLLDTLSALTVGVSRMAIGVAVLVGWLAVTDQLDPLFGYSRSQWAWLLATGLLLCVYVVTWYSALARAQAVDVTAVLVFGAVITATLDATVGGVSVRPDLVGLVAIAGGALLIGFGPAGHGEGSSA
jgi:drug/metabolite transporter (DMT)-like permease